MEDESIQSLAESYINGNISFVRNYIDTSGSPRYLMARISRYMTEYHEDLLLKFLYSMSN